MKSRSKSKQAHKMSFFVPYMAAAQDLLQKIEAQTVKKRKRCLSAHMSRKASQHLGLKQRYQPKLTGPNSEALLNDEKRGSCGSVGRHDTSKILIQQTISEPEPTPQTHVRKLRASSAVHRSSSNVRFTASLLSSKIGLPLPDQQPKEPSCQIPGVRFKNSSPPPSTQLSNPTNPEAASLFFRNEAINQTLHRFSSRNSTGYPHYQAYRRQNVEQIIQRRCGGFEELMREYYRRMGERAKARVFVFDSKDEWMRRALLRRGWSENLNRQSRAYHLRWGYRLPKDQPFPEQMSNHYPKTDALTSKSGLHSALALHQKKHLQPVTFDSSSEMERFVNYFNRKQVLHHLSLLLTMFEFECELARRERNELIAELDTSHSNPQQQLDHALALFSKQLVSCLQSPAGKYKYSSLVYDRLQAALGRADSLSQPQQHQIKLLTSAYYLLCQQLKVTTDSIRVVPNYWIVKSKTSSKAAGLTLTHSLPHLRKHSNRLFQEYISQPLLLRAARGRKFDLRVWVLVVGSRPMRVFYFDQFYGRISGKQYSDAPQSLRDPTVHLTNYTIHREQYAQEQTISESVLLPQELFKEVNQERGFNYELQFYGDLERMVGELREVFRSKLAAGSNNFFQLFGVDLLLDAHLRLWLLEVNLSASCEERHPHLSSMLQQMGEGILDILQKKPVSRGWREVQ